MKHANSNLTQLDSGVPSHKMTWSHEKMHLAETVDDGRMKFQRNSTALATTKPTEKFDLFKKLHELYNELSREEASQISYVSIFKSIFGMVSISPNLYLMTMYIFFKFI